VKQEDELPTACPAVACLLRGGRGLVTFPGVATLSSLGMTGAGLQARPDRRERWSTARAQEAVVADFDEALGQHMLELCGEVNYVARRAYGAIPPYYWDKLRHNS